MTGASGLSVETSEYLPYGGNRDQSGTSVSDYRFTDQELDTSTGFYNYDARLYDPVIGRFVSADTIVSHPFDPQGLNRYSYCRNNPLIYVDPSGHSIDPGTTDPGAAIKDANEKAKAEGIASLSENDSTGNENSTKPDTVETMAFNFLWENKNVEDKLKKNAKAYGVEVSKEIEDIFAKKVREAIKLKDLNKFRDLGKKKDSLPGEYNPTTNAYKLNKENQDKWNEYDQQEKALGNEILNRVLSENPDWKDKIKIGE